MIGVRPLAGLLVLLGIVAASSPCAAQEGILSVRVDPSSVEAAAGGRARITLRVENTSAREADNLIVEWIGPSGFAVQPEPAEIAVLRPLDSLDWVVSILVPADSSLGQVQGSLECAYTYCVGDLCYQVAVPLSVRIEVTAAPSPAAETVPVGPSVTPRPPNRAAAWIPYAVAAFVALWVLAAAVLARAARVRWPLYVGLALAAVSGLAYGVVVNQHEQAQGVASVLCTSCVGIEEASEGSPHLSADQVARVRSISEPVDLLVFFAPWCRSCPFAEALVEQVGALNPRVAYRLVNVDAERGLAERYGIVTSGRTVVPAIVRIGVDRVLFGIENLEARLVLLLEEAS